VVEIDGWGGFVGLGWFAGFVREQLPTFVKVCVFIQGYRYGLRLSMKWRIAGVIWTVGLLFTGASVSAQTIVDAPPATEAPGAPAGEAQTTEVPVEIPYSLGSCAAPNFFVVNSSHCPQEPNGCYPRCRGVVHQYLPDGRYHRSSSEQLLASLKPGTPVCVMVHGSFVKSDELYALSVRRYKRLVAAGGNRPMHFIAAHWPSDPGTMICPGYQVEKLSSRAEYNGIYLAQFIRRIPADNPVSLIGHSHGCRVISSALHLLGGGCVEGVRVSNPSPHRRMRVVFGAGAIDHHWLNPGEKYGCALNRVECLLNVYSRWDCVLKLYPFTDPLFHHAVGQRGFTNSDLKKIGYQSRKIRQLDVTHLVGTGHAIANYAPYPQIRAQAIPYLYFD